MAAATRPRRPPPAMRHSETLAEAREALEEMQQPRGSEPLPKTCSDQGFVASAASAELPLQSHCEPLAKACVARCEASEVARSPGVCDYTQSITHVETLHGNTCLQVSIGTRN